MVALLLTLSLTMTHPLHAEVHADMIEVNHHLGPIRGEVLFTQVILWERLPYNGKYRVVAWKMLEDSQVTFVGGMYRVTVPDGLRTVDVRSRMFRESWSQEDPEAIDKKKWGDRSRLGLPKVFGENARKAAGIDNE